jgi:steroid 5-alpha reductase family enzyme
MSWQVLVALIAIQWASLALIMAGGWAAWRATRNSGWIDVTWTFAVGVVGAISAILPLGPASDGFNHLIVAAMIAAWALRLGLYIASRTAGITDDPRYAKIIEDWGDQAERNMFWFLQVQAFFGVFFVLAVALAAANPAPFLSPGPLLGLIVFLLGIACSATADSQLASFKEEKVAGRTAKRVCDGGLWAYSRHPNYFFEVVIWSAFAIFALDFSGAWNWGLIALLAPLCMYWLLRYVSGVPPLEEHMVARYGDDYRAYQKRVSVFVPWPPTTDQSSRIGAPLPNSEG